VQKNAQEFKDNKFEGCMVNMDTFLEGIMISYSKQLNSLSIHNKAELKTHIKHQVEKIVSVSIKSVEVNICARPNTFQTLG